MTTFELSQYKMIHTEEDSETSLFYMIIYRQIKIKYVILKQKFTLFIIMKKMNILYLPRLLRFVSHIRKQPVISRVMISSLLVAAK